MPGGPLGPIGALGAWQEGGGFKVQHKNLIAQPGRPIRPTGDPNGASSGSHSGHFIKGDPLWLDREPVKP